MAEKIVKKLQFPGSSDQYLINACALEGKTLSYIMGEIQAVEDKIDTVASFDALRYMGVLSGNGGTLPKADKGDVYKVTVAGTLGGATVEVGDMLICNKDGTPANTPANWDIIQGNIDVEAILEHTHTGTVTFTKSDKTLSHSVTPTTQDLTTTFSNGAATVTGNHGHTASGSVTITPNGSVENTSITPEGTVKLTSPTNKGTNDVQITPSGNTNDSTTEYVTSVSVAGNHVHTHTGTATQNGTSAVSGSVTISTGSGTANYTPAGTIANASKKVVTAVEAGDTTVSAHVASSVSAGGFTPAGTVTVNSFTPAGTVQSHKHDVSLTKTTGSSDYFFNTVSFAAGIDADKMDGVLTFGRATAITACDTYAVDEISVAPTFTGAADTPTATFSGTPVEGHTHTITVEDHDTFIPVVNATAEDHNHTFSGTGVQLVAAHNLAAAAHTHSVTVNANDEFTHTVTAPTEAHKHAFTGNKINIGATFTGTAAQHNHTFTGAADTHNVSVDVNNFTGNFTGTATGTVTPSVSRVLTGVTIDNHTVNTVDSGSFTTGTGTQQ